MKTNNPVAINKYLGLYTSKPSHLIPDYYVANTMNMSYGSYGFLSPMKGYSNHSSLASSDNLEVVNSVTFRKGDGQQVPIIAIDDASNVKIYWWNEVDDDWDFLQDLTTNTVPSFSGSGFNLAASDWMYWANGTDTLTKWNGAIGTILSNTATVITLNTVTGFGSAAGLGFTSTGSVIVNGTSYTYTGLSGWTLTGCTALPTFDANEGVAQASANGTGPSGITLELLTVADGRLWGARSDGLRLYYSKVGDGDTWAEGNNPDDPGVRDFVEGGGPILGLNSIKEYVLVGKADMIRYFKIEYPSSTTKTHVSEIIRQGDDQGVASHFSMVQFENSVYYLSPRGGVRNVSVSDDGTGFLREDVTEIIRPTIKKGVFTDSRAAFFEKERIMLFSYKTDSDSTKRDKVISIEFIKNDSEMIHKAVGIMDWTVGGFFQYLGNLYFGSSFEGKIFKAIDGYTKAGNPHTVYTTFKKYDFGAPLKQKDFEYIAIKGYIGPGQYMKFQLDYDDNGSRATAEADFSADETDFVIPRQLNTIGAFALGTEPLGGTIDDIDELDPFLLYMRLPEHKPFNIQLTVLGEGIDKYGEPIGNKWIIEQVFFEPKDAKYQIPSKKIKYFKKSN